uniref:RING-type domain-containing protein n=1 Tax=Ditylenchus dipsaci TaxID=166011 RepID=A0A915DC84_9BILA
MNPNISPLQNPTEHSTLLNEFKKKVESESKCQICWELSIGPIICCVCGNNVGCSKCVNRLFTSLNPTAKCPLCNAKWKRDPQDSGNTSLWTDHCPNRALAGILNQINQLTCSNLPTIKPSPVPSKPPKLAPKKFFHTNLTLLQIYISYPLLGLVFLCTTTTSKKDFQQTKLLPLSPTSISCYYLYFVHILA